MLEYAWISKPEAVVGGEIEILSYVCFEVCGGAVVVEERRLDPISKMGCGWKGRQDPVYIVYSGW
jgi:hypothetical protein